MTGDQFWRPGDPISAPSDAPNPAHKREAGAQYQPHVAPLLRQAPSQRSRLKPLVRMVAFSLRRALIPSLVICAIVFALSTYMRIETDDAKIALAHTRARYAVQLGQPGTIISLTDRRDQLHRISADRLTQMPHVAELAEATQTRLIQNATIGAGAGLLWLVCATFMTARRLL